MKAIRPIYDGKDDLEYRTEIDPVDMMVCLFSETNERIKAMEDITEDEREKIMGLVDLETLPPGILMMRDRLGDIFDSPEPDDDGFSRRGTEFDEIIVLYEITRWMQECGYEWNADVPWKYSYTAFSLGILPKYCDDEIGPDESDTYVLRVGERAFNELKLLLPLHWAVILLDWDLTIINSIGDEEILQFGNLTIVHKEERDK